MEHVVLCLNIMQVLSNDFDLIISDTCSSETRSIQCKELAYFVIEMLKLLGQPVPFLVQEVITEARVNTANNTAKDFLNFFI